jgi:hypothetical protein
MNWSNTRLVMLLAVGLALAGSTNFEPVQAAVPNEIVEAAVPVDDAFWLQLDRQHPDKYRAQLKAAPQVLVVRGSHYDFNPTNGIGTHYGWLDGRLANLHIPFAELVWCAYGTDYAHTDFPQGSNHGHWTNGFDLICTITNQPEKTLPAAAREFLRQQCGLTWHVENKDTAVLLIRAKDPQLLQSKATKDFAHSKAISELAVELENYFGQPVIDETGATNRYDKNLELVPARWFSGHNIDVNANNTFLAAYGLELVPATRPQAWLMLDR